MDGKRGLGVKKKVKWKDLSLSYIVSALIRKYLNSSLVLFVHPFFGVGVKPCGPLPYGVQHFLSSWWYCKKVYGQIYLVRTRNRVSCPPENVTEFRHTPPFYSSRASWNNTSRPMQASPWWAHKKRAPSTKSLSSFEQVGLIWLKRLIPRVIFGLELIAACDLNYLHRFMVNYEIWSLLHVADLLPVHRLGEKER